MARLVKAGSRVTYLIGRRSGDAEVMRIELCRGMEKYGTAVDSIDLDYWPDLHAAVLDLNDGHWIYAGQILEVQS